MDNINKNKINIKFLHIGKTGGSFIKYIINKVDTNGKLELRYHHNSILDGNTGPCIFFVRDPVKRFISGFISRLRKGQPRIYSEWSRDEQIAFTNFKTPDELATSLSSSDKYIYNKAIHAMNSISHVKMGLSHYLIDIDNIKKHKDKIIYVGKTETMNNDLENVIKMLGYNYIISNDDMDNINTHKTPANYEHMKCLSDLGKQNIIKYFSKDYEIIKYLISEKMIDCSYINYLSIK